MNIEDNKTKGPVIKTNGNQRAYSNIFSSTFEQVRSLFIQSHRHEYSTDYKNLYTDYDEAIKQITTRRQDKLLEKNILEFLNGDIPRHFKKKQPTLYLSRHIATPNYEILKFIEQTKDLGYPYIIGEDLAGKFVSKNETKRALTKLPVIKGINRFQDEILENFTIVDFKKYEGKIFSKIKTKMGGSLVKFHHDLLREVYPKSNFVDESKWISRHSRENLLEHYKKFLALFLQNGIMFEIYYPNDREFVENILYPAIVFIEGKFGYKPLICKLECGDKNEHEMTTYPSVIYAFLQNLIFSK